MRQRGGHFTHVGQAPGALEQANAAYHAVLENAQDAIVLTDSHGRINNWNRQAALSFGRTLEEALGQDIIALLFAARFHGAVGATIMRQRAVEEDTPRLEVMALRRDGSEFPIELSVTSTTVRSQFECSFFSYRRDKSTGRMAALAWLADTG